MVHLKRYNMRYNMRSNHRTVERKSFPHIQAIIDDHGSELADHTIHILQLYRTTFNILIKAQVAEVSE
jgi:hypothetical protein